MTHAHATRHDRLMEAADRSSIDARIQREARACLCLRPSTGYRFDEIQCRCDRGVLTLLGRVPSFYLKQLLQTIVRDIDGLEQIDNQVNVVNSEGLSSVRRTM